MDHGGREERLRPSISRREAYVSCRGYVGIPQSARPLRAVKQGGAASVCTPVLGSLVRDGRFCVRPGKPHGPPTAAPKPKHSPRVTAAAPGRPRTSMSPRQTGGAEYPPRREGPTGPGQAAPPPPSSRAARVRTSSVRAGAVMVTSGSPHAGSMRTSTFIFEPSPLHPQYRQKPAACLQICDRRPVFRDNWRGGRSKKARGGQLRGRAYRRTPAPGSSGSSRRATFR